MNRSENGEAATRPNFTFLMLGLIVPNQMNQHPTITARVDQLVEEMLRVDVDQSVFQEAASIVENVGLITPNQMNQHPTISALVDQLVEEMLRVNVDQSVFQEAASIVENTRSRRAMGKVNAVTGLRSLMSEFSLREDTINFDNTDASSKSTFDCKVNPPPGKIGYYRGKVDEDCIIGEKDPSRQICCNFDNDQVFLQIVLLMLDYADAHQNEGHVAPASYRQNLRNLLPPNIPNTPSPRVTIGQYLVSVEFYGLSDASVASVLRIGQQLFRKINTARITISQLRSLPVKETLESDWTFFVVVRNMDTLFPVGRNPLLAVKNASFHLIWHSFEDDHGDSGLAEFFTNVDGRRRQKLALMWSVRGPNKNIDFSNTVLALGGSNFRGEVKLSFVGRAGVVWPNITIQNQTFNNGLRVIVYWNGSSRKVIFKNDNQLLP